MAKRQFLLGLFAVLEEEFSDADKLRREFVEEYIPLLDYINSIVF